MGLDAQGGTNENTEAEPRHARTTTVDLPRFNDTERAQRIGEQLRKRDLIHFGTPEVCSCCCIKCIILTAEPGVVDYYNLLHLLQIFSFASPCSFVLVTHMLRLLRRLRTVHPAG